MKEKGIINFKQPIYKTLNNFIKLSTLSAFIIFLLHGTLILFLTVKVESKLTGSDLLNKTENYALFKSSSNCI